MDRILIGDTSEVRVGRGIDEPLPARPEREKVAVLHQPSVASVARRVAEECGSSGAEVLLREVADREAAKHLTEVGRIYRWLAQHNLGRHDTVVGVGGGALTDVAGFVAATWLRGVESVLVPTTLLGAVDAAIGGKSAINVGLGDGPEEEDGAVAKNLVGAFWHPRRVVVDLDVLDILPPVLRTEGTAEILKAGLLADPGIVDAYLIHGGGAPLDELVPAAIRVKAEVVAADFREGGRRALLNLGHTVGHAVEGLTGMPHGHAVAVGLVAEGVVSSTRFGFDHRWLVDLVFSLGLPVAAAGIPRTAARELILRDKKRTSEGVRMVLLRGVGAPEIVPVTEDEIDLALSAIGAE